MCRIKRNVSEYEGGGGITDTEAGIGSDTPIVAGVRSCHSERRCYERVLIAMGWIVRPAETDGHMSGTVRQLRNKHSPPISPRRYRLVLSSATLKASSRLGP